jgi:hypothetical protein
MKNLMFVTHFLGGKSNLNNGEEDEVVQHVTAWRRLHIKICLGNLNEKVHY